MFCCMLHLNLAILLGRLPTFISLFQNKARLSPLIMHKTPWSSTEEIVMRLKNGLFCNSVLLVTNLVKNGQSYSERNATTLVLGHLVPLLKDRPSRVHGIGSKA